MKEEFSHIPVLLNEVIDNLNIKPNGIYVDCTLGGAGHSSEIVKKLKKGILIGFDKDINAILASKEKLSKISYVTINSEENIKNGCLLINEDFKNAPKILKEIGIEKIDGVLMDLGVSSYQIDTAERGFSYRLDGILDMRMNTSQSLTAKDIVNTYSEEELVDIFKTYGEEEFSHSIAKNIVKQRQIAPIETTLQLNEIVENSMPKKVVFSRGGASKKVFQALRIVVNSELEDLSKTIESFVDMLNENGRICIISFHSLEDRIVKSTFKDLSLNCICPPNFPKCVCNHKAKIKLITKKPIIASSEELKNNSRSSCAKLRIAEKI